MRKLLVLTLIGLTTGLYASYNGNPAEPSLLRGSALPLTGCQDRYFMVKLGYLRDDYERKLKASGSYTGRMDEFILRLNQGVIALTVCRRVEAYATFGAANLFMRTRPNQFAVPAIEKHVDFESRDRFVWGVGARGILYEWCGFVLGLDGNYRQSRLRFIWDGLHEGALATRARVFYRDFQVGLAVAKRLGVFTPYLGVKYSGVYGSVSNLQPDESTPTLFNSFRLRSREHWGMILGVTLSNCCPFDLTVEASLFDQLSLAIEGRIQF